MVCFQGWLASLNNSNFPLSLINLIIKFDNAQSTDEKCMHIFSFQLIMSGDQVRNHVDEIMVEAQRFKYKTMVYNILI